MKRRWSWMHRSPRRSTPPPSPTASPPPSVAWGSIPMRCCRAPASRKPPAPWPHRTPTGPVRSYAASPPAAVRSVSRRILADAELRADADAYVRAFGLEMQDQARRGDAHDVQARLATDEGRAFMLLDAAIGDLG